MRSRLRTTAPYVSLPLACAVVTLLFLVRPLPVPEGRSCDLDLERVRALATAVSGALPLRVGVLRVAESTKPAAALLGGVRFDRATLVWTAFQIHFADASIVVDAAADAAWHQERAPRDRFDAVAFAALQRGLVTARKIVVTHEHPDHVGGLRAVPNWDAIRDRVHLTREQIDNRAELTRTLGPAQIATLRPLHYAREHALAPGVVLIKAPGHTPGSQMVYVQQADKREILLIGDIAWNAEQVRGPQGRPRISAWLLGEDSNQVGAQLRALHELSREHGVLVVPSHDGAVLDAAVGSGWLQEGFE